MNADQRRLEIGRSQGRVLSGLLAQLSGHWRRDAALPRRIEDLIRRDRRFGSRDRRLYRELIYTAVRHLPRVEPLLGEPDRLCALVARLAPDSAQTRLFKEAFPGDDTGLSGAQSRPPMPEWLALECPEALEPARSAVLNSRAPLWLRLQADDPAPVLAEFDSLGWPWKISPLLPGAIALPGEPDVTATRAYRSGQVEIQDLGSQLVLESAGPSPGSRWLDACAGAGGKSLQLAKLLGPDGRVFAHDVREEALDELDRRALRAGLSSRIARDPRPAGPYDGVLLDAPCTGSGTWRRQPHLKWVTTPESIAASARLQLELLGRFAPLVRPGGLLVYATCSLCSTENEGVLGRFLEADRSFAPEPWERTFTGAPRGAGLIFWPEGHDGDCFFAARLRRCAPAGALRPD